MSDEPLRVALDLSCAFEGSPTGVGYVALHQARALMRLNETLDLRFFATRARGIRFSEDLRAGASRTTVFPNGRRLKQALWSRVNWPPIEWFCGGVDAAHGLFHLLPATARARRIVTIYDLVVFRHPETHTASTVRTHKRLLTHAARHADALITISESCRQDVLDVLNAPPGKVHLVPLGVSPEEFAGALDEDILAQRKDNLDLAGAYWICIGTIEPRKNLCRLLEAYRRIVDRFPECPDLLLVGRRGWLAEPVFQTIAQLRLAQRVKYAGYLKRSDVILLLRGSAACLYPSLYEGFGLPVLEAMAAQVPVLTSKAASMPEVIGPHGIIVEPQDVDALEWGLEQLLTQPAACQQMAARAFERACSFSWENSARRLVDVYRAVCGRHVTERA